LSQSERLHVLLEQYRTRTRRPTIRRDKDVGLNGSRRFQFLVLLGLTKRNRFCSADSV
jgi:hypothetical protein